MIKKICLALLIALATEGPAFAAHPLITDDVGTQGTGKFQLEVNGEYASDRETSGGVEARERAAEAAAVLSAGLAPSLDVVFGVPVVRVSTRETDQSGPPSMEATGRGISDLSLELKWRFYETEGLSLAMKPGVSAPAGDEEKGLGAGRYGFSAYFIATRELSALAFHLNAGYIRNNNRAGELENLYHFSLAGEYGLNEDLRCVVNIGQERNPDRTADRDPAFGLAGLIYAAGEAVDVDVGVKAGLTDPETDLTILLGSAWRF